MGLSLSGRRQNVHFVNSLGRVEKLVFFVYSRQAKAAISEKDVRS